MTANVISFGDGVRILRGDDAEATRLARIKLQRRAAYNRATRGEYNMADVAMFGTWEEMMRVGPTELPSTPPIAPRVA